MSIFRSHVVALYRLCLTILALAAAAGAPADVPPQYTIKDLGALATVEAGNSHVTAMNDAGVMAGLSYSPTGQRAWIYQPGGPLQEIGTLGGNTAVPRAISNTGAVVGYSRTASGHTHAFLYEGGVMLDLGTLEGSYSEALAINSAGQVVGHSYDSAGRHFAFLWDRISGMRKLALPGSNGSNLAGYYTVQALNEAGQVAGTSNTLENGQLVTHAFVYDAQAGMRDLGALGGLGSQAYALGEGGEVVGQINHTSSRATAFYYDPADGMLDLGGLGGQYARAHEISDSGEYVLGQGYTATGRWRSFVWSRNLGMREIVLSGGTDSFPMGVNSAGQVVGYSTSSSPGWRAYVWDAANGIRPLVLPGGSDSLARAINAAGQVVGDSHTVLPNGQGQRHAFLWDAASGIRSLGTLGGGTSYAFHVNDAGHIAGQSFRSDGAYHAFRWDSANGMVDTGAISYTYSHARALNNVGEVAGTSQVAHNTSHAFKYSANGGMVDLGSLGGNWSDSRDIGDGGHVAGNSDTGNAYHAFRHDGTSMVDLGSLGGGYSEAIRVNAAGQVIGYSVNSSGRWFAFTWDPTNHIRQIALPDAGWSHPRDINATGQVIGVSDTNVNGVLRYRAFLWHNGIIQNLGTLNPDDQQSDATAINASGQVVGVSYDVNWRSRAFIWQNGVMQYLGDLGGGQSYAFDVNDSGQVVGQSLTSTGQWHAFLWQEGVMTDLGELGGGYSYAQRINNAGQVVGWSYNADGSGDYFLYSGGGMRRIRELPEAGSGWGEVNAHLLNDRGELAGSGVNPNRDYHALLLEPGPTDTAAPQSTASVSPEPNAAGWNRADVTVTIAAEDNTGGTGVKEIRYTVNGGDVNVASGAAAPIPVTSEGVTTIKFLAVDNAGNAGAEETVTVRLDKTAPVVVPGTADGQWHGENVSIACTASDAVSGLANSGDAAFSLTTSVPAGEETDNAATGTRLIADLAGNEVTTGPIAGNKVDLKAPSVQILSPEARTYLLNEPVSASYAASDGGSGIKSVTGPVPNGTAIDTASAGARSFTVIAEDNVGNVAPAVTVNYTVGYGVVTLFDPNKAHKAGSTVPIKLKLVDAGGVNVSNSELMVTAIGIHKESNQTTNLLEDSGEANPDSNFRFDASLGGSGGYIYNLSLKGYTSGKYVMTYKAGGDPTTHSVHFFVK